MRIMLAGDTHGNLDHLTYLADQADRLYVDRIIQLGDFGFVFQEDRISEVHHVLERFDLELWWLDGNHENYDLLKSHYGAEPGKHSATFLTDRIRYLPRGYRFDIDGLIFMSVGGAVSIDRGSRIPGVSWWPQESISQRQYAHITRPGKVDVILSHDGPWPIPNTDKRDPASLNHQHVLRDVVSEVKPNYLFHGHYHSRYNRHDDQLGCSINGLSRDGTYEDSWTLLDTEVLTRR